MGEAASTRSAFPVAEAAWVIPLATVPIAAALLWGASDGTFVDAIGPLGLGGMGFVGLTTSLYSARIVSASSRADGPPVALALVPFVAVAVLSLPLSRWLLEGALLRSTGCSPAPRILLVSLELADVLLFRAVPLFICAAGALTVALAAVYVARPLRDRGAWGTIAASAVLSWSLTVSALAVVFAHRKLLGINDESFDEQATWLQRVVGEYREHQSAANTLLLASFLFAAATLNTRRRFSGLVTFVSVLISALAVRSAEAIDAANWQETIEERTPLEDARPLLGSHVLDPQVSLETDPALSPSLRMRFNFAGPVLLTARRGVQDSELRKALRSVAVRPISDVVFVAPVARFEGAPVALQPLVTFQESFDTLDTLSVRFMGDEPCLATNSQRLLRVKTPAGLVSPWELPCDTVGLESVGVERLHSLAAAATSQGRRLVVLVPRTPLE